MKSPEPARARDTAIAEFSTRIQREEFAIISGDTNTRRETGALAAELQSRGLEVHRARGVWANESEDSLIAFGRGAADAAGVLALRYDQKAYISSFGVLPDYSTAPTLLHFVERLEERPAQFHKLPSILGFKAAAEEYTDVAYTPKGQESSFVIRFRFQG